MNLRLYVRYYFVTNLDFIYVYKQYHLSEGGVFNSNVNNSTRINNKQHEIRKNTHTKKSNHAVT